MFQDDDVRENRLLIRFPVEVSQRITPYLEVVEFELGQIIYQPHQLFQDVYFPIRSVFSLVLTLSNGSTTEIGLIGNEGMLGLPVVLGYRYTIHHAIVQVSGNAFKLDADLLKQEFDRNSELHGQLLRYTHVRLSQISQIAACKSHHSIPQRLARWLLSVGDCLQQDSFGLTQKFIAEMLGVRRASVTEAASALQNAGIIRYSRGQIEILDRAALESWSCECYHTIKSEFDRSLNLD
ncbi:MAG: Crp/Fnr family transcriptional regulator [Cyanobacteria bacterium SID2]|nr:Crp/Fnr family transcriptional regulator [Cyanobacteria bacterium SID2]